MRRFLLLCAAIAAIVWLEFAFYPGHTYLRGRTQLYVPALERLAYPSFLSRDLVATHPFVTYTIYDEVTLFLKQVIGLHLQAGLTVQQLLCRAAAVAGVFLMAGAAGFADVLALVVAAVVNLGIGLAGPTVSTVGLEPIPRVFAFGLVLLALGLLLKERPLLGSLIGGIALVYDARIAAIFWIVFLLAAACERRLRPLCKAGLPILLVFVLLLANFAQLQQGEVHVQIDFGKIPAWLRVLQQSHTGSVWVSSWAGTYVWQYAGIYVLGLWAIARIWPILNRQARWFFLALPAAGLLSVAVSYLGLECFAWFPMAQIQPAQNLLYTAALAAIACALAAMQAAGKRRIWEAGLWFAVVFALASDSSIFDFLRPRSIREAAALVLCFALAFALAALAAGFERAPRWPPSPFAAFLAALFAIPALLPHPAPINTKPVTCLADWALKNTWGSSLFLFPDAGRSIEPGSFRVKSRRGLWVDWQSGALADYFEAAAAEWSRRWRQAAAGPFTPERLQRLLPLGIDYYVLKKKDRLANVAPVFQNRRYVVYDANDLRAVRGPLRLDVP
ncbi:MAG: hypothetical protein ACRD45_22610 [Bryobacteraceae bacterium]